MRGFVSYCVQISAFLGIISTLRYDKTNRKLCKVSIIFCFSIIICYSSLCLYQYLPNIEESNSIMKQHFYHNVIQVFYCIKKNIL